MLGNQGVLEPFLVCRLTPLMSEQTTTLTFFRYPTLSQKVWAFGMMQFAHGALAQVPGLVFYKLLGSGRPNFDPRPDWSTYGLLQVWEQESQAKDFFANARLFARYQQHSAEQLTFWLKNLQAHGQWSGKNVFEATERPNPANPYLAVITRATIRTRMLRKFWAYVPTSQLDLVDNPHLLFTAGVGEVPITQMATFSLWDDATALQQFAYRNQAHRRAVQQTRDLNWYKEELFARFQPYRITGDWRGFKIPELLRQ